MGVLVPRPADANALQLDIVDGLPVVRLPGRHAFHEAVDLVADVIRVAVAEGRANLLLDARGSAFGAPTLVDRLRMVRRWADAADGRLRIAIVARPDFIDAERFGVVAAGGFGLPGQVFELEEDAIAWLRDEHAAELRWRSSGANPLGQDGLGSERIGQGKRRDPET